SDDSRIESRLKLAMVCFAAGRFESKLGESAGAEMFRESVDLLRGCVRQQPVYRYRDTLASVCLFAGQSAFDWNAYDDADGYFREAIEQRRAILDVSPTSAARRELAKALQERASGLLHTNVVTEAEQVLRESKQLYQHVIEHEAIPADYSDFALVCFGLAEIHESRGQSSDACSLYKLVIQVLLNQKDANQNSQSLQSLVHAHIWVATYADHDGDAYSASNHLQESLRLSLRLLQKDSSEENLVDFLQLTINSYAYLSTSGITPDVQLLESCAELVRKTSTRDESHATSFMCVAVLALLAIVGVTIPVESRSGLLKQAQTTLERIKARGLNGVAPEVHAMTMIAGHEAEVSLGWIEVSPHQRCAHLKQIETLFRNTWDEDLADIAPKAMQYLAGLRSRWGCDSTGSQLLQ
ncbi:MAG TPA: hypothetical protein VIM41_07400, partial [Gammaproteobacteria bacterium]